MKNWRDDANCRDLDPELFYTERHTPLKARLACEVCPVQEQCLEYALQYEEYGYWAGTTRRQRTTLRKKLGIQLTELSASWHKSKHLIHGTESGYQWEVRLGIDTCIDCREAHALKARRRAG